MLKSLKIKRIISLVLSVSLISSGIYCSIPSYASVEGSKPSSNVWLTPDDFESNSDEFASKLFNNVYNLNGGKVQTVKYGDISWDIAGFEEVGEETVPTLCLFAKSSLGNVYYNNSGRDVYNNDYKTATIFTEANTKFNTELKSRVVSVSGVPYTNDSGLQTADNASFYLADGELGGTTVNVGTSNQFTVNTANAKTRGSYWLRSSAGSGSVYSSQGGGSTWATKKARIYSNSNIASSEAASSYTYFVGSNVNNKATKGFTQYGLVPTFNLNLKSLIFASSAPASTAGSSFATDNVMDLRFDSAKDANGTECTDKIKSTAAYDANQIRIRYESDDSTNLYLYVQGNDGTNDFVYSTNITKNTKITANQVKSGLTDLSNCKIWLEKQVDKVNYAKMLKKTTFKPANIEYIDKGETFVYATPRTNIQIGEMKDVNFTGDVTYTAAVYDSASNLVTDKGISVTVSGKKIILTTANNTPSNDYYIKIIGTDGIDTLNLTQTVTVEKIKVPVPTVNKNNQYTGSDQIGVSSNSENVTLEGDTYATNVGTYTALAKLKNKTNYAWDTDVPNSSNLELTWYIVPRDLTIEAINKTGYVEEAAPVLNNPTLNVDYKLTGLLKTDNILTAPTLSYESTPDMSKSGSVKILISGINLDADMSNYNIIYKTGVLNIVDKPPQEITFTDIKGNSVIKKYGENPFKYAITNKTANGGKITYRSSDTNVAEVDSDTGEVTIKNAGETVIYATVAKTATNCQTTISYSLKVEKSDINLTDEQLKEGLTAGQIQYGQPVSASALGGGRSEGTYAWENGSEILDAGNYTKTVIFTPNNKNYNQKTFEFDLTVLKAKASNPVTDSQEGINVNYSNNTVDAKDGYTISSSKDSVVPLEDNKFESGKKYYVRKDADKNYDASDWVEFEVYAVNYGLTAKSIKYGQKLSESLLLGGNTSGTFTWKDKDYIPDAGTTTSLVIFTALDKSYSVECSVDIYVEKGTYKAPEEDEGYNIDYSEGTIIPKVGYEISSSNASYVPLSKNEFSAGNKYYVRKAEDNNYYASDWTEFSVLGIELSGEVVDDIFVVDSDGGMFYCPEYTKEYLEIIGAKSIDLNGHSVFCVKGKTLDNIISNGLMINVTAKLEYNDIIVLNGEEIELMGDSTPLLGLNVVKIGLIYYSSLEEAVNDAKTGDTITLLSDNVENINISEGKDLIFNKNGYNWTGTNTGKGTVTLVEYAATLYAAKYVNEDGTLKDGAKVTGSYDSFAQAIQQAKLGDYIKLTKDVKESSTGIKTSDDAVALSGLEDGILVNADKKITVDLNGYTIYGNMYVYGEMTIVDTTTTYDSIKNRINIGTGQITGNLQTIGGSITIKSGIFNPSNNSDKNLEILKTMLQKDSSGNTLSSVYLINNKWIVLPEGMNLNFNLSYKVFTKDATIEDFENPASSTKLVKSVDSDDISDLAWGEEYQAVIYLNTEMDNVTIRSFEFTSKYPEDILDVNIKPNAEINKFTTMNIGEGEIKYSLSANQYTLNTSTENFVAAIKFTVNNEELKPNDSVKLMFGDEAYIGTMDSINSIPISKKTEFEGHLKNMNDGVEILDYAYAPKGYKLAIISNEHTDNSTLMLTTGEELFYTENPAYVEQSTNPQGLDMRGNINTVVGVYLALVEENKDSDDIIKCIKVVDGNDNLLTDEMYSHDINRDGKVSANDASLVYQMLKGEKWGYSADNEQLYIPTFERLISEANHDGKLYGTIEDVNVIINKYTGLNLY